MRTAVARSAGGQILKKAIKQIFARIGAAAAQAAHDSDYAERTLLLQGAQASLLVQSRERLGSLSDAGFRVFSQFDEDGIIEWIVSRLPAIPEAFIEFGVEDYWEANTRFLLRHRNWRGLVMDGSVENVACIKGRRNYWQNELIAVAQFVDCGNINDTISANGFATEIGLLSIDIDGNDYWIWEAINVCNPWIVVVEYNAVFGDLYPLTIPYDPAFHRTDFHYSNLYSGSGIRALERLGHRRNYVLIGSNRAGHNAFFVRKDLYLRHLNGRIADMRARPSIYRESKDPSGTLSFVRGAERKNVISDMSVVDVERDETVRLGNIPQLYSPFWLQIMG
jgi:hypothetical protein